MKKRFLLINPWIEDVSAYDYWLKPLGLLYISSMLENMGYDTFLIDNLDRFDPEMTEKYGSPKTSYYSTGKFKKTNIRNPQCMKEYKIPRSLKRYGFPEELFREKLRRYKNVDAIFVTSMMTYWHYGVSDTIRVIREELGDKRIILGGVYATLLPDHAKKYSGADFVSPGTGCLPLKNALDYLQIDGEIDPQWFHKMEPSYEKYPSNRVVVITSSTGCPFRCVYCSGWKLWNGFTQKDPESVVDFIQRIIERYNSQEIIFFDDALLIGNVFKNILKLIIKRKIKTRFHLPNGIHVRFIDKEMAELMKEANFKTIMLGYETSDPELQKATGGKVTDSLFIRGVSNLKDAGFKTDEVSAYIMANLPYQREKDVYNAIEKCVELGILPKINEFTPIPGTEQFNDLVNRGWLNKDIDPLLLDNSILPYWWEYGFSAETVQNIKNYSNKKRRVFLDEK